MIFISNRSIELYLGINTHCAGLRLTIFGQCLCGCSRLCLPSDSHSQLTIIIAFLQSG
jgi:hypothetical protein